MQEVRHQVEHMRIARPKGRARIETLWMSRWSAVHRRIARPKGRARIETYIGQTPSSVLQRIARPKGRARIETTSSVSAAMIWLRHRPAERPGAD